MTTLARCRFLAASAAALVTATRPLRAQQFQQIQLVGNFDDALTPVCWASHTGALRKGSAPASLNAHLRGLPLKIIANGGMWGPRSPNSLAVVAADSQLWEPLLLAGRRSGKVRPLADGRSSDAIGDSYVISVYFSGTDFAEKHPQLLRTFARVTYESARYTNSHSSDTWQLMSDTLKMPLEVMRHIYRQPGATSGDPALLQPLIDCAAKYGNIARDFPAKDLYVAA